MVVGWYLSMVPPLRSNLLGFASCYILRNNEKHVLFQRKFGALKNWIHILKFYYILFGTSSLDDFPTGHFQFVHPKHPKTIFGCWKLFSHWKSGFGRWFSDCLLFWLLKSPNFQCFFSRKHWHVLRWGPRQQGAVSGRWVGKKDGSFFCNINGCAQIN